MATSRPAVPDGKHRGVAAVLLTMDDLDDATALGADAGRAATPTDGEIVVFWRPACGFCASLRRELEGAGVAHRLVNIWEDPEGAATVRTIARGNETVPTVVVGPTGLVNPSLHEVLGAVAEHAPGAVPEDYEPPEPGRVGRWVRDALGG